MAYKDLLERIKRLDVQTIEEMSPKSIARLTHNFDELLVRNMLYTATINYDQRKVIKKIKKAYKSWKKDTEMFCGSLPQLEVYPEFMEELQTDIECGLVITEKGSFEEDLRSLKMKLSLFSSNAVPLKATPKGLYSTLSTNEVKSVENDDNLKSITKEEFNAIFSDKNIPSKEEKDSKEDSTESVQTHDPEVLLPKNTEIFSKQANQENEFVEVNIINAQQANHIKKLKADIKDMEADMDELKKWKHLSREQVALFCHALAEYCKFDQKTKQNDIAPMAHELFGIGKKSAYNIMVSGYSKKDREHVAKIFEAIWPPFADFILKIFDKKEQQLKQ